MRSRKGSGGARSHEELIAWQLAYELKTRVYALIRNGPITRDHKLVDQLEVRLRPRRD